MNSATMKQLLPAVVVAILVAVIFPRLGLFAPFFAAAAAAGWAVLAVWTLHRAEVLPQPLAGWMDRLAPSRGLAALQAEQQEADRKELSDALTAERVQAELDEWLIGQELLNAQVGRAVEIFVGKKNPAKPLSILLAGPGGSGRTTFAEGLAAVLAPLKAGRLLRIDCASDIEIDFADIAGRLSGLTLPVLLLDNVDRIGDQRHAGGVMTELTRVLDSGMAAGKPLLRRCIVVLTSVLDAAAAREVFAGGEPDEDERALRMRQAVTGTGRVPQDILNHVDLVTTMKPLSDLEQVAVVWKTFCSMAAREHEITIVEDSLGLGDGVEDFLIEARERWMKAGVSGVREAARFISKAADDAFLAASRAGHGRVRARWDRAAGRIRLDPVPEPQPADGVEAAAPATVRPGAAAAHADGLPHAAERLGEDRVFSATGEGAMR